MAKDRDGRELAVGDIVVGLCPHPYELNNEATVVAVDYDTVDLKWLAGGFAERDVSKGHVSSYFRFRRPSVPPRPTFADELSQLLLG